MLSVNGKNIHIQVMADTPLLLVLRNNLALNGRNTAAASANAAPAPC